MQQPKVLIHGDPSFELRGRAWGISSELSSMDIDASATWRRVQRHLSRIEDVRVAKSSMRHTSLGGLNGASNTHMSR